MPGALQNHGNPVAQRYAKLLSRTCRNNRNSCYFSPGGRRLKFCRQNGPRFGVRKRTPKWRPLIQSQFDLLVSGRLGPRFGVRFWTPKRGPFVGKIFAAGRKIAQVSIVSAGTRQKFCIPLGHWVPMVLQRREQLFSTPCERLCPHMFLNWGGPLWRPWTPLRFWRLVLGPSMDKIFARVVIRLAASHSSCSASWSLEAGCP